MERTGSEFGLLLLVLVALRDCAAAAVLVRTQDDPHSLRYEMNITSNNQPRCVGQGHMDRVNLLLFDCDNNEVKYMNNMLKGTKTLENMTHKLKDMNDLMRGKLPDITPEKRDSIILQVRLECQSDANGIFSGSLELGFNGQRFLAFDAESGEYKVDDPRDEQMKEKWENDEEVTKCFKVFLNGDCKESLKFLTHKKKELETTAAPTTATTTAPVHSKAMNIKNIIWILPVIFLFFPILGQIIYRRCCSKAPETGSSSRCVPSGWRPCCRRQVLPCDQELQPL